MTETALEPIISATPIVITDNFEQVKAQLVSQISLYEIEVTEDNLSDAKKMATELNKLSSALNRIKIDKSKEFAAPIEEFKKKAAELIDIVQTGRAKILSQVEAFDRRTLETVRELLVKTLEDLNISLEVRPEFRTADISGLIIKSNLTTGGQLSKATKDKIFDMVQADKTLQGTVDLRLKTLQDTATRAGLHSLSESLIMPFIREPEPVYLARLQTVLDAEIKRQKDLEERIRAEESRKLEAQQKEAERKAEPEKPVAGSREHGFTYYDRLQDDIEGKRPTKAGSNPEFTPVKPQKVTPEGDTTTASKFEMGNKVVGKAFQVGFGAHTEEFVSAEDLSTWIDMLNPGEELTMRRIV